MGKYYLWSEDISELTGLIYSSNITDKDRIWKIFNDIYMDLYCNGGKDIKVELKDKECELRDG